MQAKLPGTDDVEQPDQPRPPTIENSEQYALPKKADLPDIPGIVWGLFDTDGETRYVKGDTLTSPAGVDTEQPPHGELPANAVVEGVGAYIESYGIEEIEIPDYYSRFSDFEPVINTWTTTATGIGYGIEQNMLRGLVRLANGSGRIDHDKTHVILCENDTVLVTGPRGAFIKDLWGIKGDRTDEEPPADVYQNVRGFSMPEENETALEKTEAVLDALETYTDYEVSEYQFNRDRGKHIFHTTCGREFYPRGGPILEAGPASSVVGEHTYDYRGTTYSATVEPEDIDHGIGDTIAPMIQTTKTVLGYTVDWKIRDYVFSGNARCVDAILCYVTLTHTPAENSEGDVYLDYAVNSQGEIIESYDLDD
ncbi:MULTISPECIES: hypothetical protein [Haloferacaceae]|uniref:Halobacterial output domain-containing protein n=2 Tax=Haloferacaceae TaxID=1644056 RepID=A0ABD6DCM3_9EURY|nr:MULTISPECIES: hypothetical protein [Halorubraceae]